MSDDTHPLLAAWRAHVARLMDQRADHARTRRHANTPPDPPPPPPTTCRHGVPLHVVCRRCQFARGRPNP